MDRFRSGDAYSAGTQVSFRFTTARTAIFKIAAATLITGCLAGCAAGTASDSGSNSSLSEPSKQSTATTASSSANPSEVVGADKVPGLGTIPNLSLTIDQTYPVPAPPLDADTETQAPFVQGLEFEPDGSLLMGTGLYGESQIFRFPNWLENPAVEPSNVNSLSTDLFGEGITRHGDTVWQLTWKEGRAIARDATSLEQRREVPYNTEGWGACSFDDTIVTSDGSGTLTFRSPEDLSPQRQLAIKAAGQDTTWLNELECVTANADGGATNGSTDSSTESGREVWANVWQSPFIYRIDPQKGEVTGIVDATDIFRDLSSRITPTELGNIDVLNGIALIPESDANSGTATADGVRHFLLTGKKWPIAYRVTVGK